MNPKRLVFFLSPGIYSSNDVAVSFPNTVSGSGSSTPVSSSHLPQQTSGHVQQMSPSSTPSVTAAVATTQVGGSKCGCSGLWLTYIMPL